MDEARTWLQRIRALPTTRAVRIMHVCGGHERSLSRLGLRALLPAHIELISGPGCPVCICPEEDVLSAIELALTHELTLVTFGDMMRVPANTAKGEPRTLSQARAHGADIRPIASPLEAVAIARAQPERETVFFAVGFETTMAPLAAMLATGIPANLSLLLAGRRTWPAVAWLLQSGRGHFDALIAPGHVATIMGTGEWSLCADRYHMPTAVAGFEAVSLLAALYSVLRQIESGEIFLDNCYGEIVHAAGNQRAQSLMRKWLHVKDAAWRGIGHIPTSGYALASPLERHDARQRFGISPRTSRPRAGAMPAGCACADVVMGSKHPNQCPLYGKTCTPESPIGPCMVSDEGACRIWWSYRVRQSASRSQTNMWLPNYPDECPSPPPASGGRAE